jgi:uncharacterized protein
MRPKHYLFPYLLTLFFVSIFVVACSSPGDETIPPNTFDRKAMLQHYADDLIRPAFRELQTNVNTLSATVETFMRTPSASNLTALQTAWLKTQLAFEVAHAYNFGPAGESRSRMRLAQEIGTFPVNTLKIEKAIAQGIANTTDTNYDARGLLAIEYMLFDKNGNNEYILKGLETASRQVYLKKLVTNVKERVDEVVTGWDGYVTTFVSNDGTAAGSSTSELYNEFIRSYENLKNHKIGFPLGARAGQTVAQPELAEGYYSGQSLALAQAHFTALQNHWYGRTATTSGPGFREYLASVPDGPALVTATETQLAAIRQAFEKLSDSPSLTRQIQAKKPAVESLYTELQKNTLFFRSDMASLLGIAITFSSSDGG